MSSMCRKSIKAWQREAIMHASNMCHSNACRPILLVRPTGDGKSIVRNTCSSLACGVTLTICPLLSLSADQCKKLQHCDQDHGPLAAFHLDEMRSKASKQRLHELLLLLPNNTNKTVFLFTSPQVLINDNNWIVLTRRLLQRRLLLANGSSR